MGLPVSSPPADSEAVAVVVLSATARPFALGFAVSGDVNAAADSAAVGGAEEKLTGTRVSWAATVASETAATDDAEAVVKGTVDWKATAPVPVSLVAAKVLAAGAGAAAITPG